MTSAITLEEGKPASTTGGAASGGWWAFVRPRLVGPAVAMLAYLPLRTAGLVAPVPIVWFYGFLVVGTALTLITQRKLDDRSSTLHLCIRVAAQCTSITGLIYVSGYGAGLGFVYLKTVIDNLPRYGGRTLVVGMAGSGAGMLAGQLGIAAARIPSLVPLPEAHVLAFLVFVGQSFVAWLLVQLQTELQGSEARLREAQRLAHIGSWHWDIREDSVVWTNELYRIFGIDDGEIDFRRFLAHVHPQDRDRVREAVQGARAAGGGFRMEHRVVRPSGEARWLEGRGECVIDPRTGEVVAMRGTGHDITERKELEEQLLQATKLQAAGELTSAIAHDFNNFIHGIRGFASLLEKDLPADSEVRTYATQIYECAGRANELVTELLAFSHAGDPQPELVQLDPLLEKARPLLEQLLPEGVRLELRLEAGPARVRLDPGQLRRAVMNLVTNARDAMAADGTVRIHTDVCTRSEGAAVEGLAVPHVRLAVSDTGIGMDADTRARIFEPFFTTKGSGRGTGLGLATVYRFVTGSDGDIEVESRPGEGTTFRCVFPRVDEADAPSLS